MKILRTLLAVLVLALPGCRGCDDDDPVRVQVKCDDDDDAATAGVEVHSPRRSGNAMKVHLKMTRRATRTLCGRMCGEVRRVHQPRPGDKRRLLNKLLVSAADVCKTCRKAYWR